jgi:WD40 repeat protein
MIGVALILISLLVSMMPARAELPTEPILRLEPGMHGAPILRIDVDADERFLVTASHDKTVRVWSLDDGQLLKSLRVPIGLGNVGKVYAVAISPDGERIAAGGWLREGEDSIYIFDRASGRIVHRIDSLPNVINHLTFSPDGRHLVACLGGSNGIRVFETAAFDEVAADRDYGGPSNWAAFEREGRLVTSSYDGQIRLYDPGFRLIESKEAPGGGRLNGVAFSPDGEKIAVGYEESTRVDVLDSSTLALLFETDHPNLDGKNISSITWSTDGRFLYAGGTYHTGSDYSVRRWADGGRGAYEDIALSQSTIMDLRLLADGRLAFGAQDPTLGVLDPDDEIRWRKNPAQADFRGQEDVLAVGETGERVRFGFWLDPDAEFDLRARHLTPDPEADSALTTARTEAPGLEIEKWKNQYNPTLNGELLPLDQYERSRSLAIAPDGQYFLLGTEWSLRLFDRNGEQLWEQSGPGTAWAVNITGDGRLAVAAFGDGTIRWFRLEDGAELLAFFPHAGRERWVVWTPQGYYMASPGGEELIGWHVNRGLDTPEFYTAGRFRDRFHRPDVIALVLEELDVEKALARANAAAGGAAAPPSPAAAKAELTATLPPVIEIVDPAPGASASSDFLTITYLLRAQGNVPPKVSAHLNGQFMKAVSLGDKLAGEIADQIAIPLAGRVSSPEFTVSLIAEDDFGASDPASVTLRWGGATKDQDKVRLLVLAVGVSDYANDPPRDLDYAAKDASDIASELLHQKERGLYRDVKVRLLTNKEASKIDILDGLKWLYDEARPGDVALVYFAGHGRDEPMGGGLVFHYLPHEVDVGSTARRQATGLSKDVLLDELTAIYQKGAKVLTFLDTCYSGAVGGRVRDLAADIDLFAAELASAENGVVVFTSSKATQVAKEDPVWENGAFTEALLELLSGKAIAPGRDYVSISDLKLYMRKRVQELTGGQQTPEVYNETKLEIDAPIFMIQ